MNSVKAEGENIDDGKDAYKLQNAEATKHLISRLGKRSTGS